MLIDAQMLKLLKIDADPTLAPKLRSVLHYDGLPIDARSITESVLAQESEEREERDERNERAR